MKALSFRPPWASVIVVGVQIADVIDNDNGSQRLEYRGKCILKNIENRSWPLPQGFTLPQRIYVHASTRLDQDAQEWMMQQGLPIFGVLMHFSRAHPILGARGAIVGEVDITGCVTESKSPWFVGPYGFTLANPLAYEKPIPCKGRLGFFEVDIGSSLGPLE